MNPGIFGIQLTQHSRSCSVNYKSRIQLSASNLHTALTIRITQRRITETSGLLQYLHSRKSNVTKGVLPIPNVATCANKIVGLLEKLHGMDPPGPGGSQCLPEDEVPTGSPGPDVICDKGQVGSDSLSFEDELNKAIQQNLTMPMMQQPRKHYKNL
jgi:hypothetical protein